MFNFKRTVLYSGAHLRSDAYSSLLSKPQLFSMAWRIFKILLLPWQSGSKQNLIGGFQKGRTCSCISRDTKVAGCQTCLIFQRLHFYFYVSYCHMKTAPPMNTFDFFNTKTLIACNFAAPWGTRTCFTFLKTSNQYLFGARLPRGL